MNNLGFRADHQQTQRQSLSPRFQQAVRLLQMSSLDFAASVRDVLGKNPFLEVEEGDGEADQEAPADDPGDGADSTADSDGLSAELAMPREGLDEVGESDNDRDLWIPACPHARPMTASCRR